MKTWEMIKELTENPKKKFNNEYGSTIRHNGSSLVWEDGSIAQLTKQFIEGNWEEVKQPVTWQEAIQAWVDGKEVICMLNRAALEYAPSNFGMENQYQTGISYREIKEGEWYINE